jgi:hypothetical protein
MSRRLGDSAQEKSTEGRAGIYTRDHRTVDLDVDELTPAQAEAELTRRGPELGEDEIVQGVAYRLQR